jgi:hypothetical protein
MGQSIIVQPPGLKLLIAIFMPYDWADPLVLVDNLDKYKMALKSES